MSALLGAGGSGSGRTALPVTTFFVRTDGSDTTGNGKTDTAAGAYQTFQFAFNDIINLYDFRGNTVTITAGNEAGTKTFAGIAYTGWTGGGALIISGNGSSATVFTDQTTFSGFGDFYSESPLPGTITYQNCTIGVSPLGATGISMVAPSVTKIGSGVIFAAQGGGGVGAFFANSASVILEGPFTVDSGTNLAFINIGPEGNISDNGAAVITFNGGVTLSRGFLWLIGCFSNINPHSTFTITGSFTGPDVQIEAGAGIRYGSGSPIKFWGGSANPVISDGVLQIGTSQSYDTRGSTGLPGFFGDSGQDVGVYVASGGFDWVIWNGGGHGWVAGGGLDPFTVQSLETGFFRDANGQIGQRSGTTPQKYSTYGTFTNASNYERLSLDAEVATASTHRIRSEAAGTGTVRIIAIDGFTKAGAAAVGDLPAGTWALIHDSSGATTKLVYNDAGTLRTVALV